MWRCVWCGKEFEQPAEWEEYRGECFGYRAYEPVDGCPYCHGDYLSEEDYRREILGEDDDDDEEESEGENDES